MKRRDFLRLIGVSGVVAGAGLGLTACSDDQSSDSTGEASGSAPGGEGGAVRVAALGSPSDELDPAAATAGATWVGIYAMFESLVALVDGKPVNQLAESLTPDDTAQSCTITLREGAQFSDGSPVTAEDALASLKYSAESPMIGPPLAPIDFDSTRAVDDSTIELHLHSPRADLIETVLGMQSLVFKGGDPAANIGSGPFVLQTGTAADGWVFGRNDMYPDSVFEKLEIRPIADPEARANAVASGDVDYACDLPLTATRTVTEPAMVVNGGAVDAKVLGFVLNTRVAPFNNPEVRSAFKMLIERQALVDTALGDDAFVGDDVLGKGLPGYPDSVKAVSRDEAKAREILEREKVTELELVTADVVVGMNDAADLFARQCEAAGVTVSLDRRDPASYFADIASLMELPLFAAYWVNRGVASGLQFTTGQKGGFNLDGFGMEGNWDKKMAEASAITDEGKRADAVAELAQEAAADNGLLLWGFQPFLNGTTETVGDSPTSQSVPVFGG